MKKYFSMVIAATVIAFVFSACFKDKCRHAYKLYIPVYKTLTELRASVKSGPGTALDKPGKIYIDGNWIYVNEKEKGIHVIDNSTPQQPRNVAFINIPGNIDISIKNSILYADLYCDLAAIDISNPQSVVAKKYLTKTFPSRVNYTSSNNPDSIMVIVDWITRDTIADCQTITAWNNNCNTCPVFYTASSSAPSNPGTAGSMARFASLNDHLYAVSNSDLNVIDISNAADPVFLKNQGIGWNIETIFPYNNKLFIGAGSSMSIYDVQDPVNPKQLAWSGHWCSSDPVVADDKYAYVTLHDADVCRNKVNQLEIYSLEFNSSAQLKRTYPLTNPQGLSKDGNLLFICDGRDGLEIFDISNVMDMKLLKRFPGINPYDVIALNGIAYVTSPEGLYQYGYSNRNNIHLLSKLRSY
jgi:hypothetical protein